MKKILLAIALVLASCSAKVGPGEPKEPKDKLSLEWIAKRTWNMEQGAYEFGILFRNVPEEPVLVQGYICYSLVNSGQCNDSNLRMQSTGILSPYIHGSIEFTLQDYIYARGLEDYTEKQDFFNRQKLDPKEDESLSAGGVINSEGEVILLFQVYELRLLQDDLGNDVPGKLLAQSRYILNLSCTSRSN